jgi:hypothetical protein
MLALHLLVADRPDVPQRVMATCCRRQGAVVALAFERGGPDGTAELALEVEVDERLRRGLIDRIAGLVDVLEVTPGGLTPLNGASTRGGRGVRPPGRAARGSGG